MRFALDTNVLVYAFLNDDRRRHSIAAPILMSAAIGDAVLPVQVLAEFLNVVRRKHPHHFEAATTQAQRWQLNLKMLPTTDAHVIEGAKLAARHKFQLWDAVIWQVSRSANASLFLSEDLQDGLVLDGMKVIDPFNPNNATTLEALRPALPEG